MNNIKTRTQLIADEIRNDINTVIILLQAVTSVTLLLSVEDDLFCALKEREYNLKLKIGQLHQELKNIMNEI